MENDNDSNDDEDEFHARDFDHRINDDKVTGNTQVAPSTTNTVPSNASPSPSCVTSPTRIIPLQSPSGYTWSLNRPSISSQPFVGTPGLLQSPLDSTPFGYFSLLVTEQFLLNIVEATNHYASKHVAKGNAKWKDLTLSEFKIFIGLFFHMGTIKINRLKDYWKTGFLFGLSAFAHCMSRDRFCSILRNFYFTIPPANEDERGRLWRVEKIVDYVNKRMTDVYSPVRELSIDESLLLWRGRLGFRQYIQGKRHKYGIKFYMLTEPNGIVLKFMIYAGSADKEVSGAGHVSKVVEKLLSERFGVWHHVHVDNFYTSVDLARSLLQKNTHLTGTLRASRKNNPVEVTGKKLKRGEEIHRYSDDGICVQKWKDRKEVLVLSTEHDASFVTVKNRTGKEKQKPLIVTKYNMFMGGVDHHDQMLSYFPFERKTIRWYKKVGAHCLHILFLNSFLLYKKYKSNEPPTLDFYGFRLAIIESLLQEKIMTYTPSTTLVTKTAHYLLPCPKNPNNNRILKRICKYCKEVLNLGRKEVNMYCAKCDGEPGFHFECFPKHHDY